jgi:cytochrome c553
MKSSISMSTLTLGGLALALGAAVVVHAQDAAPPSADAPASAPPAEHAPSALPDGFDVEQAERLYGVCVHCHGAHGEGRPELGTPRIGDLTADYVYGQLTAFRNGTRGAHAEDLDAKPMRAIATGLGGDETVKTLATFVEHLAPEHRSAGDKRPDGEALFQPCIACHGADARGNPELKAPDLLFQDSSYLARQLKNYRDNKRGADGADPLATAMAAQAAPLSDENIEAVVAHIASLRPERPALNNYEVSVSEAEGLKAFGDIYAVATHPRCMNCHPDGDRPLHTDRSIPHDFNVTRFTPLKGTHCSTCHAALPVGEGVAPAPPADPIWSLAPKQMVFENRTPKQLCEQLKDPEMNGGRGFVDTTAHIANDHLLMTSWHSGRAAPPIAHAELVKRFETWGKAGGPCPAK